MGLNGPSKTIHVEPLKIPAPAQPAKAPSAPAPASPAKREPVPA
jgi:hypothetical protein